MPEYALVAEFASRFCFVIFGMRGDARSPVTVRTVSFKEISARFCEISFQKDYGLCVRGEGVQGVLTLFCGGVAQTCHDDQVVELKEQL